MKRSEAGGGNDAVIFVTAHLTKINLVCTRKGSLWLEEIVLAIYGSCAVNCFHLGLVITCRAPQNPWY